MTDFFKITKGIKKADTVYLSPKNGYPDPKEINRILTTNTPLILDNSFTVKLGRKFYDIIRFMDAGNFALSQKVKLLLSKEQVTGWTCFPIKIDQRAEGDYFAFQLTSKSAEKFLIWKD